MDINLLNKLDNDDVFGKFLSDSFDVKDHANRAIQETVISEHLGKLAEGIALLDREIHSQIVSHHEDLLSTATGVETLEGVLQTMQSRIQSLLTAMDRIRSKVTEPYIKIKTQTCKLRRLQETCDLLRKIIRIMYMSKKLHTQLEGGSREITKAAQSLNELDYVCEGADLSGIDVIEQDRRFIKQARKEVEVQAQKMLELGMESQSQIQVATALQVFYNLSNLDVIVQRVVCGCKDSLYESIRSSLDSQALTQQLANKGGAGPPGRSTMPAPGNTAAYRANLWTNLGKLMDAIYSSCAQIQHLQKVLTKKHDPVTHVCFIDELSKNQDEPVNIMSSFWLSITTLLTNEFAEAANGSTFLKQAFEGEYPKLLRLYNDLWRRLQQFNVKSSSVLTDDVTMETDMFSYSPSHKTDPEASLRSTLQQFETAYLSRSLSRLFDPINLVFSSSSSSMPTTEEVDTLVKTIISEMNVAAIDTNLTILIAKNVAKTIQLFCVKSEQLLCTEGDATQVIGPATFAQTQNVTIVNTLYHFYTSITKVLFSLENLPEAATHYLTEASKEVVSLMSTAIQPLWSSIADALDAIILSMHDENFSDGPPPNSKTDTQTAQRSLYMKELQGFISHVHTDYLSMFTCADFIMDSILPVACRCVELFVRHSSLIRPLGDGGKLRLAADFAQAELAVAPLCRRVSDLGKHYKILRAFRPLLFQTSEHISQSSAVGDVIPYSVVIHFLFARAPSELKSPHQLSSWSVSRYSRWLDEHPNQQDQLLLIKGALEAYVQFVKSRQGKEFASIYPVMLELLQRGLQET